MKGLHADEGSVGGSHSKASSKGLKRLERGGRREQQRMQEGHQTKLDSDERSLQRERTMSYIPK